MAYEPNEWSCGDTVTAEKLNAMERGISDMNADYVPTEWVCGDVITAEKLNHMEQGIANGCEGGGSSDFSTAEVTVNISRGTPSFSGVFILSTGEPSQPYYMTYGNQNLNDGDVIQAVMYDGEGTMDIELSGGGGTPLSVSGAGDVEIEMDEGYAYAYITGDCTITIS